jgi:hypothetical protein
MPTQKLQIGSIRTIGGRKHNLTRTVQFEGEEVATRTAYINQERTRWVTETLYYATDGRLIVHVENWSQQEEQGTIYSVLEITGVELQKGGRFEELGHGAWAWLRR